MSDSVLSGASRASETANNQKTGILKGNKVVSATLGVAIVLTILGIGLWVFQLWGGMLNTNMRNLSSWGLYIILFMLFVGLSAGGLIISSIPKVTGLGDFGGINKIAIWTSITCTLLAVGFVVVDLGSPWKVWELFAYANFSSPLMWDIIALSLYLIISIIYLWATLRYEKGKLSNTGMRALSAIALVAACAVHTVTAWIFGLQISHEFWYTALLGPWFISSALLSGLALVLIVVFALSKLGYVQIKRENILKMTKLLGVFTAIDLYFFACDLLTSGFVGGESAAVVTMLTQGPLALFFWFEIAVGVAAMFIAFVPKFRRNGAIVFASCVSILAILCKRIQLLIGGFQIPNIDYWSTTTGPHSVEYLGVPGGSLSSLIYAPSLLELGVAFGVVALGVAILIIGLHLLPLKPLKK
ncbi:MAG: polysulfide reductase NrfD [Coriobacteriales bacterium]|jgi:molybdopterin-containing oxidoreductase family membrane subunit|nr:polysulfide reductase NrfD [Coriobacteriales bacterium]